MSTHQIHFERKFYLDKKTGYWISTDYTKERPRIRAHQWVWINNHGAIPKSYHIHHINDDKSDNRIENLELILGKRHLSFHSFQKMKNPILKEKNTLLLDKIRPLTKQWHASEEGRTWHKYNALKHKFGNWEPIERTCQICQKKYKTKQKSDLRSKFCSNNCKSQHRRNEGLDMIEKDCILCGYKFTSNKYNYTKTCSRSCGSKLGMRM